jgi:hypothetical protein
MNRRLFPARLRAATLGIAAFLMVACGNTLEGRYAAKKDKANLAQAFADIQIEFKPGHKANYIVNALGVGNTMELDYEISGKELKLKTPQGTLIATIAADGCLEFGGTLGTMCKQEKK